MLLPSAPVYFSLKKAKTSSRLLNKLVLSLVCFFFFTSFHNAVGKEREVILAFGDSITHGYKYTPYSAFLQNKLDKGGLDAVVVNSGVNGEVTSEGAARIKGVLQRTKPKYVFVMEGANDAIKGLPLENIINNLNHMIVESKKYGAIPVLSTITPNTRKNRVLKRIPAEINPAVRDLARRHEIKLVDNFERLNKKWTKVQWDGLHPHNYGQLVMAENWFTTFKELEKERAKKRQIKIWAVSITAFLTTVLFILFLRKRVDRKC